MKKQILTIIIIISVGAESGSDKYAHNLYIFSEKTKSPIAQEVEETAKKINLHLFISNFFDTEKIVSKLWVNNEYHKDPTHKEIEAITQDNKKIKFSYFNRNSDTLLIVGPGFSNSKEKMAPFVHMFTHYDIAIFNYRGHGIKDGLNLNPMYILLGIDNNIRFGAEEEKDLEAVIKKINELKKYKEVIGLGICFGGFVMIKAQAIAEQNGQKLFDKLILDGAWQSLKIFVDKIYENPGLILNPQSGRASKRLQLLFFSSTIKKWTKNYLQKMSGIDFNEINIMESIKRVTIPILYFYGKDDLTISRTEFETVFFNLGSAKKAALITSNPHVYNHLKSKELYKTACEIFIDKEFNEFEEIIVSKEKIVDFYLEKLKKYYLSDEKAFETKPAKIVDKKSRPA